MKKYLFLGPALLLLASACTNDNTERDNDTPNGPGKGLTAFVVEDNKPAIKGTMTRTTAEYDGSGLNFYWTAGDPLWVNKAATGTPELQQSYKSNITEQLQNSQVEGGVERASKASFYFEGTFNADKYIVRYTGKNGTKDKVTIKNEQTQTVPNDASHIGESGDCGTAPANKQPGNRYTFMLDHKASYIVFLPYNTPGAIAGAKLTKIKVTADKAIAGEFSFNDQGIVISSRPESSAANNSITLNLSDKFTVPAAPSKKDNAAIMVIAPGIYSTFTVEYTLNDPKTHIGGTVTKKYTNVTFTAGLNKKVSMDLQIPIYGSDNYYMWDAAKSKHYWAGHENDQPTTNGSFNENYPKNSSDPRWYNKNTLSASKPSLEASNSCANVPNINECVWYVMKGKPYWDDKYLWSTKGHLYNNGMWFKKLKVIAEENGIANVADLKNKDYKNKDWRNAPFGSTMPDNKEINKGTPNEIDKYFFLPAMGKFENGTLNYFRIAGLYWTSTADRFINARAHNLYFTETTAIVSNIRERKCGCCIWKAK